MRQIVLASALLLAACADGTGRFREEVLPSPALLPAPTLPPVADYGACTKQVQELAEAGLSYLTAVPGVAYEREGRQRRPITFNRWYFRRPGTGFAVADAACNVTDIDGHCSPNGDYCPVTNR